MLYTAIIAKAKLAFGVIVCQRSKQPRNGTGGLKVTCKDCVHVDVCEEYGEVFSLIKGGKCSLFKDRSRFVELPCKLGDTLYTIVTGSRIREWIVVDISFFSYSVVKIVITADSKDNNGTDHMRFGKHYLNHSVFLSREAAEQALKERES